jgi:uncharacterized protein (DUF1810 family)
MHRSIHPFGHFLQAQASPTAGLDAAMAELAAGRKQGHWVWYVFPQLAGLGRSEVALRFALEDADEARDYLAHPLLGPRLRTALELVAQRVGPPSSLQLVALMGSELDAAKLVSSCTLFQAVAVELNQSGEPPEREQAARMAEVCARVLAEACRQGLPPCRFTRSALGLAV